MDLCLLLILTAFTAATEIGGVVNQNKVVWEMPILEKHPKALNLRIRFGFG